VTALYVLAAELTKSWFYRTQKRIADSS